MNPYRGHKDSFQLVVSCKRWHIGECKMLSTTHQMNIDCVMFCLRSCRNEESLFPGRVGGCCFSPVVRPSEGSRRKKEENVKFPNLPERSIKVPMHWFWPQIFSTQLHLCALPQKLLSRPMSCGSVSAPKSCSTPVGHSGEGGVEASDQHGVPKSTQGWADSRRGRLWRG